MRGFLQIAVAAAVCLPATAVRAQAPAASPAPTVEQCLSRHAEIHPDAEITRLISIVDVDVAKGDVDEALIAIASDTAAHPDDSRLKDALGRVHYRRGELTPSIAAFNDAIRLDPCNARAHYDAWRVDAIAGLYQAAEVQLQLAYLVNPNVDLFKRMWLNTRMQPLTDPPHFNFYSRNLDCDGIPVRAHAVVDPDALPAACAHIRAMLAHLPNVRANMIAHGSELHLYGEDQHISDLPEYRDERGERKFTSALNSGTKVDIDLMADGLGGIYSACPSVNVLHQHDFRSPHAEVCIHEMAHNIMGQGFDARMRADIERQYKASLAKGLWRGAYAATNPNEFFAELSAWYFGGQGGVDKMAEPVPAPGPAALKAYDPDAFDLIDRLYAGRKQPGTIKFHPARVVTSLNPAAALNPEAAELLLINNTGGRMRLYFVRKDGSLSDFGILEPYTRRSQSCYTGETWLLEDPRTRARTLFTVPDESTEFTLN
jgi:tetratricopeptide (TPR) repeat protein